MNIETTGYSFTAAQPCDVAIGLRPSESLTAGDTVEFQFPNSWCLVSGPSFTRALQSEDAAAPHFVSVRADGAEFVLDIRKRHLCHPTGIARHGRHIVATLTRGTTPAGALVTITYANTFAPYVAEEETLWLRVKGAAPETPVRLRVTGRPARDLRVIAPSVVRPGEEFEVRIVSLDEFQNVSSSNYKNVALRVVDGDVLRAGISFTGRTVQRVSLAHEGVFRLEAAGVRSNAVRVSRTATKLWWGDLHIHTKLSMDAQGSDPYGYAREVSGLEFAAVADHWESLGAEGEQAVLDWARAADEPGRFAAILADERNPANFTGHHNLYFRNETAYVAWRDQESRANGGYRPNFDASAVKKDPPEVMIIPHHTGIAWGGFKPGTLTSAVNLDAADDQGLRPVMEIYSHHGQSETYAPEHILAYEFNRMRRPERRANASTPGQHYAQDYWRAGRRLGVIGSSDDHAGQTGIRHGGIAAVRTNDLSREGIFDALFRRDCYATTGERILLDFTAGDLAMGTEGKLPRGAKAPLRVAVWGTALLLRVELMRYRDGIDAAFTPLVSHVPQPFSTDAIIEIEDEIKGPCIYYVRALQEPLEWPDMAWSSPIWIEPA